MRYLSVAYEYMPCATMPSWASGIVAAAVGPSLVFPPSPPVTCPSPMLLVFKTHHRVASTSLACSQPRHQQRAFWGRLFVHVLHEPRPRPPSMRPQPSQPRLVRCPFKKNTHLRAEGCKTGGGTPRRAAGGRCDFLANVIPLSLLLLLLVAGWVAPVFRREPAENSKLGASDPVREEQRLVDEDAPVAAVVAAQR